MVKTTTPKPACACDCDGCREAHPDTSALCGDGREYGGDTYACGRAKGHDGRHEAFGRNVSARHVAHSWSR